MSAGDAARLQGRKIVVGYDGSDPARAAVTEAARRAGPDGLLVVVHSHALPRDLLGLSTYELLLADREKHGRAVLQLADRPVTVVPAAMLDGESAERERRDERP